MSSAPNGVGLWSRLCATLLLKAHGAEVCYYEKGCAGWIKEIAGWIEEMEHVQRWTITQVQVGNGKSLK